MAVRVMYLGRVIPDAAQVSSGGQIRDHNMRNALNAMYPGTVSLLTKDKRIDMRAIPVLLHRRVILWVEFPTSLHVSWLALLMSCVPWVRVVLDIQDLPIEQSRALGGRQPSLGFRLLMRIPERLLFLRCQRAALASPGFRLLLPSYTRDKTLDLPPGCTLIGDVDGGTGRIPASVRRRLLYAGGINPGRMLDSVLEAIASEDGWEFVVVGFGDPSMVERIRNTERVVFLGRLSYPDALKLQNEVDAIIVPYPSGPYFDLILPSKLPDSLASCKPVIMTRLPVAESFVRRIGLEGNVIFEDRLTPDSIRSSLRRALQMRIDRSRTIEALRELTWEEVTRRALPLLVEGS